MVCAHNNLQKNWINITYAQKQLESTKAFKNRKKKKKLSNLETNLVPDFSFKAMKTIVYSP